MLWKDLKPGDTLIWKNGLGHIFDNVKEVLILIRPGDVILILDSRTCPGWDNWNNIKILVNGDICTLVRQKNVCVKECDVVK
jgi:hypothetical protein